MQSNDSQAQNSAQLEHQLVSFLAERNYIRWMGRVASGSKWIVALCGDSIAYTFRFLELYTRSGRDSSLIRGWFSVTKLCYSLADEPMGSNAAHRHYNGRTMMAFNLAPHEQLMTPFDFDW